MVRNFKFLNDYRETIPSFHVDRLDHEDIEIRNIINYIYDFIRFSRGTDLYEEGKLYNIFNLNDRDSKFIIKFSATLYRPTDFSQVRKFITNFNCGHNIYTFRFYCGSDFSDISDIEVNLTTDSNHINDFRNFTYE